LSLLIGRGVRTSGGLLRQLHRPGVRYHLAGNLQHGFRVGAVSAPQAR